MTSRSVEDAELELLVLLGGADLGPDPDSGVPGQGTYLVSACIA